MPVVGVLIGAGMNSMVLDNMAADTERYCQTRFLSDKYGLKLPTALATDQDDDPDAEADAAKGSRDLGAMSARASIRRPGLAPHRDLKHQLRRAGTSPTEVQSPTGQGNTLPAGSAPSAALPEPASFSYACRGSHDEVTETSVSEPDQRS